MFVLQLTLQFMYDEFVEDYEPTKADSYRKKVSLRDIQSYFSLQLIFNVFRARFQGGTGWGGSTNRYSRYSGTGRLCCHSWQLLSKRWRISLCIFYYRRWKLPSYSGISVSLFFFLFSKWILTLRKNQYWFLNGNILRLFIIQSQNFLNCISRD